MTTSPFFLIGFYYVVLAGLELAETLLPLLLDCWDYRCVIHTRDNYFFFSIPGEGPQYRSALCLMLVIPSLVTLAPQGLINYYFLLN